MSKAADSFVSAIKRRLDELGTNAYAVETDAGLPSDAIRNALRASVGQNAQGPRLSRVQEICDALGLEFYFGEPRQAPSAPMPFSETETLPQFGIAKCSVQGWGKPDRERPPLPKPRFINDPKAFYVYAIGQSMIPEGIDGGDYCLVSPAQDISEGDRIWVRDHKGLTSIKRLVAMKGSSLVLRGWMPVRDGKQQSFDEERFANGITRAHPIVAVFRGRPGTPSMEFVPDPRDPLRVPVTAPAGSADFALIDLHDAQAAAGNGHINEERGAVTRLAFSRAWLSRMGIPAADASLVHVEGESMAPTLADGAVVLINHARREPRGRRIYVFRDGDELLIKRLELLGQGQLLVQSDNPEFPTRLLDATHNIEIIGEVVWTGHKV